MRSARASTVLLDSLVEAADRLASMIETIDNAKAPALGDWSIGDVAAHVSHALAGDTMLLNAGDASSGFPLTGGMTRDAIAQLNATMLEADPERVPRRLAERIRVAGEDLKGAASALDNEAMRAWLEGIELPVSVIAAHALGEVVMHGYDIGRAASRPWNITEREALLILEGFWFRLMRAIGAAPQEGIGGVPGGVEIRLRGGDATRFDNDHATDCRITADPQAFLLFTYGRRGLLSSFARGRWAISGRRPWLTPRVLKTLRTP